MSTVRVRFAPSPTGFFHIGSARTALFNWLYARHTGGTFVLRIEDTDHSRNTPEALQVLLDGMKWLGMDWDEGPEKGGEYGPYFQSERGSIYQGYIQKLRDSGHAYDHEGAVFFKISGQPQIINDAVRGKVERTEEKDFVIVRSDGNPVFHLVNVVDDITMGITHVIRGEDHLSNTSKHTELFRALGAEPPVFAHIPLILKDPKQGKGKMSKRDKGALIEEYQQKRFLPAAVRNYLALLGWNPKDDSEIMPINELIERFDLPGINKDNSRFDEKKLAHFNSEYLRALPLETFAWEARPILAGQGVPVESVDEDYLQAVLQLCQPKVQDFEGLGSYVGYFFSEDFLIDEKGQAKIAKDSEAPTKLQQVITALEAVEDWTAETLQQAFNDLATTHGEEKPFPWYPVTRFTLSGRLGGPDMMPMLAVMGKARVLERLRKF